MAINDCRSSSSIDAYFCAIQGCCVVLTALCNGVISGDGVRGSSGFTLAEPQNACSQRGGNAVSKGGRTAPALRNTLLGLLEDARAGLWIGACGGLRGLAGAYIGRTLR